MSFDSESFDESKSYAFIEELDNAEESATESQDLIGEFIDGDEDSKEFGIDGFLTTDEEEMSFDSEPSDESKSYAFIEELDNDFNSFEESNEDDTSTTDSEVDDLMDDMFDEASLSAQSDLATDIEEFELENVDSDELVSLDSIDEKIDQLTQISDETLEESEDLLDSVDPKSENSELSQVHQDSKINS